MDEILKLQGSKGTENRAPRAVYGGPGENCSNAQWKLIRFSSSPLGGDQSMEVNNYKFSPGPPLTALQCEWQAPPSRVQGFT